jgi:pSer/pThr/pTyr-binding forkhead associated (FHA) protein
MTRLCIRIDSASGSCEQLILRRSPALIGRTSDADVPLADAKVSSRHAELAWDAVSVIVTDLHSSNGTRIGGAAVQRSVVPAGSSFVIGDTTITVLNLLPGESDRTNWDPALKADTFASTATHQLSLRVESPSGASDTVTLRRSPAVIGRSSSADLSLDDARVSGSHAKLSWDSSAVTVSDSHSTNGTFVGGVEVHTCSVPPGTAFRVGDTVITVLGIRATEDLSLQAAPSSARSGQKITIGLSAALAVILGVLLMSAGGGPVGGSGVAGLLAAVSTPTPEQVAAKTEVQVSEALASIPQTVGPDGIAANGVWYSESELALGAMAQGATIKAIDKFVDPADPSIVLVTFQMSGPGIDGTITWREPFRTSPGKIEHVPTVSAANPTTASPAP